MVSKRQREQRKNATAALVEHFKKRRAKKQAQFEIDSNNSNERLRTYR